MVFPVASLDVCIESASVQYQRIQVASSGPGARFVRQTNTSHTPNTNLPEIRRWRVSSESLNRDEFDDLEALHVAACDGVYAIEWTPPDESTAIAVRIASWRLVHAGPGRYALDAELEEDF